MLKLPADDRRPLPARLRERLLAIPGERVLCRDVDRLYRAARRRVHGGEADAQALGHLASCERCRTLYGVLDAAFRDPSRPLPRGLVARLKAIVTAPRLPLLARDVRLAAAASAMLAAMLLLVVGNPAALFRSKVDEASARAVVLAEAGEASGQAILEKLADGFETRYERGREALRDGGRAYERLLDEARDYYENEKWRQLLPSVTLEGENHGTE